MPQTTGTPDDLVRGTHGGFPRVALTLGRLSVESQGEGRLRRHRPARGHSPNRMPPAARGELRVGAHGGGARNPGPSGGAAGFGSAMQPVGVHGTNRTRAPGNLSFTATSFDTNWSQRVARTARTRGRERAGRLGGPSRVRRVRRLAGGPRRHGSRRAVRVCRCDRRSRSFHGRDGGGAAVEFPQNGPAAGGIARASSTKFALPAIGTYRVAFSVPVTEAGQLVLAEDTGSGMAELPYTLNGRATADTPISGEALLTTSVPDVAIEVQNPALNPAALTITPKAGGSQPDVATLVIQQLN